MRKQLKEGIIWLFFFELQCFVSYLFYKLDFIYFRYVFYYVCISHFLILTILVLKKLDRRYTELLASIGYFLLVSNNFFLYAIVFGNLNARNINHVAYIVNNIYFFALVLVGVVFLNGVKGIWFSGTITAILALLNYHIYQFRGSVLNILDIYSIQTAWNVKNNYAILINAETLLFTVGIIGSMVLFSIGWKKSGFKQIFYRRFYVLPIVLVVLWFVHSNIFLTAFNISAIYYEAGNNNGYYYNTVLKYLEERSAVKNAPEEYEIEILREEMQKLEPDIASEQNTPNVVIVMNESFSDFSVINHNIPFSEDITENLDWIREEAVWGDLYVSVFGGNTANSEYEFLTGDSMMYYPSGSVPYSVYIGDELEALPEYFNQLGYYTCAVHPYKASGWNRPSVYRCMNFQETVFEEGFENSERIRDYVSDEADYGKVFDILKTRDDPVFCFNITMQNHGGYESDERMTDRISVKGLPSEEVPQAECYLALAKKSDQAIGDFLTNLKSFNEPTVVVFFGDHQPGVEDAFYEYLYGDKLSELSIEEKIKQYTTPFFIWSNTGLEAKQVERISLNYLSALLLKEAKLPMTKYLAFQLEELYPEYPVVTAVGLVDKNGNVITRSESDSELLLKYEQLIYNHIMDRKNTLSGVFTIEEH